MKRIAQCVLTFILISAITVPSVRAAHLSPALDIIASETIMIKTGTTYSGVLFQAADFQNASAVESVRTVKICSLPSPSSGILYLGSVPVAANQSISGKAIDNLKFVPAADTEDASFYFSVNDGHTQACHVKITDERNFAPTVTSNVDAVAAWTQKDITCFGTLSAFDPEGDALQYEIVDYPEKGLLILQDASHGDFRYTPYVGCSGDDSFTYRVRDSYGNYSDAAEACIRISRKNSKLVFADMSEHWAHSAAIEMASEGIMEYQTDEGTDVFSPDDTVTREEFLVMVMKLLGTKDLGACERTQFADDTDILSVNKPYVQAAYRAGIIRGREENGVICFCPEDAITRAESAVILNNILGAEVPVNVSLFSDNDSIPTWAQSALYALNDLGIMRGTGAGSISPYSTLTRAQTAQILFNLKQYLE